ncbi:MAG: DUF3089 domain-containing protein [Phenylobacterium sp.]
MPAAGRRASRWLIALLVGAAAMAALAIGVFREDILRTGLDPKVPFQTYQPPPAPDYASPASWHLAPGQPATAADPPADVFFVSPTTYDGGANWNAPIHSGRADRLFRRVMAPNYVGPFVTVGRVYAPRYRQASLYSMLTLREDAREARRFAYGDVAQAFRYYAAHQNGGRPFILVGVEQGGTLAARLLAEEVARNPMLMRRLAAAYLIDTAVTAEHPPIAPCLKPRQTGCVAAWAAAPANAPERAQAIVDRSLVWTADGEFENLNGARVLCFNPLLGAVSQAPAAARLNLGSANATGLEWGARPAFLTRQVGAACDARGVLRLTAPKSPSLKPSGAWSERRKAPGYNIFYANLEADAKARVEALLTALSGEPGASLRL